MSGQLKGHIKKGKIEMSDKVIVEIIGGTEGQCLAVDGVRVAGPKLFGGGHVLKRFEVEKEKLLKVLEATDGF
jgi:uncharacterized alkaline shock family protein YloU